MPAAAVTAPQISPLTTKWNRAQSVATPGCVGVGVTMGAGKDVVDDGEDVMDTLVEMIEADWVIEALALVIEVGLRVAVESVVAVLVVVGKHTEDELL